MTTITDEMKKIIEKDILLIKSMEDKTPEETRNPSFFEVYIRIKSKYMPYIQGFGDEMISNRSALAYKRNLITLKEKLELFKAMDYQNYELSEKNPSVQIVNNNLNNLEIANVFEETRKKIDNMTALSSSELDEIKDKINEIERIVLSNNSKSKKWENVNEILKWIADKGVDVGISLLPLLLGIK